MQPVPATAPPHETKPTEVVPSEPKPVLKPPPKIALALGGGAARGFAHVGVIKTLEASGISADIVVGTSAGSLVGALYAGGCSGFELQKIALKVDETSVGDWIFPDRGFIKGESLQNFVNKALNNRPLEKLNKTFAVTATDLRSGAAVVFRTGNTGIAVRASSSVPGVFQPVNINGREYVDGGLVHPIPVRVAKSLDADIVIAVDVASKPKSTKVEDMIDILLQIFNIMSESISAYELAEADVVIRPNVANIGPADFDQKHFAILEGEKAAQVAIAAIREKISQYEARWLEKAEAGR
ncbi:MAG TPA: patatin-like phospholipase family protein [Burkholderiales bacterium]|nr:patatin-like phospholipase family protein [Burkholderiales bacterium]